MSALALPRPDNVRGRFGTYVTHDVFHISERVKELSPNLFISHMDPPVQRGEQTWNFCVSEICEDGWERFVCGMAELDARVIERLEYMLHVPFEKRFEEAEKLEAKAEHERKENELDLLTETVGLPMLHDLERSGFIQRPVSYRKRRRRH